jgi:hypothetical protein
MNNTGDYCVFGLCQSSGVLKNKSFGKWICFRPQVRGVGSVRKSQPQSLEDPEGRLDLSDIATENV